MTTGTITAMNNTSAVQINKKAIVLLVSGCIALYLVYAWGYKKQSDDKKMESQPGPGGNDDWQSSAFSEIPENIESAADSIEIKTRTVDLKLANDEYKIFLREAVPKETKNSINFLLLHGMAFTSKNWVETKTLTLIAALGHRVVAVDLPGHGDSSSHEKIAGDSNKCIQFLEALIKAENLGKPVIVSPSMSGSFALPFIMSESSTCQDRVSGYIPVAPAKASEFSSSQYEQCKVPVMIVYGSKDSSMGASSAKSLTNFANSKTFVIDDAGHPCYIDQPGEWRKLLYNFISQAVGRDN